MPKELLIVAPFILEIVCAKNVACFCGGLTHSLLQVDVVTIRTISGEEKMIDLNKPPLDVESINITVELGAPFLHPGYE